MPCIRPCFLFVPYSMLIFSTYRVFNHFILCFFHLHFLTLEYQALLFVYSFFAACYDILVRRRRRNMTPFLKRKRKQQTVFSKNCTFTHTKNKAKDALGYYMLALRLCLSPLLVRGESQACAGLCTKTMFNVFSLISALPLISAPFFVMVNYKEL